MQLQDNVIHFDWAMKRILRDKADHSILNGFLTVVLGEKIEIMEILESEGNKAREDDKYNRVDVKAKDSHGDIILIEVQNSHEDDYFHRILYGTSKAITEHISKGEAYSNVKKVYSISIVYFSIGQGKDYVYHGTTEFRGLHEKDDILQLSENQRRVYAAEVPADIFLEYYILRVGDYDKDVAAPLDEWISFLKSSRIPESYTAPGLKEARVQLQIASLSPQELASYDQHIDFEVSQRSSFESAHRSGFFKGEKKGLRKGLEKGRQEGLEEGRKEGLEKGRKEGLEEGRKEGLEKGKKEKTLEIARKMKDLGLPVDQISKATGLLEGECNAL